MVHKILFFTLILTSFSLARLFPAEKGNSRIYIVSRGNVVRTPSGYHFIFEDPENEILQLLKKEEKLDEVIAQAKTDWEKILLIREWTYNQWKAGTPYPYPPWDARTILDLIRREKTGGFCAQYAIVFVQALTSLGIPARYIEIAGHFLSEVWLSKYNKWAVMDASNDHHFERYGTPLNGLELHNAWLHNDLVGVEQVKGRNKEKTQLKREDLESWRILHLMLRTDHLSNPVNIITEKQDNNVKTTIEDLALYWSDESTASDIQAGTIFSSNKDDFYWTPDLISIRIKKIDLAEQTLLLDFNGILTEKKTFFVRTHRTPKYEQANNSYRWKIYYPRKINIPAKYTLYVKESPDDPISTFLTIKLERRK